MSVKSLVALCIRMITVLSVRVDSPRFLLSAASEEIYFGIFDIVLGTAAMYINWLYVLEIFPTFLRATTLGCAYWISGLVTAVSTLITKNVESNKYIYVTIS